LLICGKAIRAATAGRCAGMHRCRIGAGEMSAKFGARSDLRSDSARVRRRAGALLRFHYETVPRRPRMAGGRRTLPRRPVVPRGRMVQHLHLPM
jgi:hypothetical protein